MKTYFKLSAIVILIILLLSCTFNYDSQKEKRGSEDGSIVIGVVSDPPKDRACFTNQEHLELLNRFPNESALIQKLSIKEDKNKVCIYINNISEAQKDALGEEALKDIMEYTYDNFFIQGVKSAVDELNDNNRFKLTEMSLKKMEYDGVSAEFIAALEPFLDMEYYGEKNFLESLTRTIGQEQISKYKHLILAYSRGILGGRKIQLLIRYNDKKGPELKLKKEREIAQEFIDNQDVVSVINNGPSDVVIPVSITYEYDGILFIATSATDLVLTNNDFKYIFRTIPSDRMLARQLAKYAVEQEIKEMIILNVRNSYGQDLGNQFQEEASKMGIAITARRSYAQQAHKNDFKPLLASIKRDFDFDMIFLADTVSIHGKDIIEQTRIMDINEPIMGGDGFDRSYPFRFIEKEAEGTIVPTVFDPCKQDKLTNEFKQKFAAKFDYLPDTWAAQGYDAIHLLADAFEKTGSTDKEVVASRLKFSPNKWQGVNGPYTFNAKGDLVHDTWFKLTDWSFDKLKSTNLPVETLKILEKIKDKEYLGENYFLNRVVETLGNQAVFIITDETLNKLLSEKLSSDIIINLKNIKDQIYIGQDEFTKILIKITKDEQTVYYTSTILNYAFKYRAEILQYAEKDKKQIYFKVFRNGRFKYLPDGLTEECEPAAN